jgi:hypothetical protein
MYWLFAFPLIYNRSSAVKSISSVYQFSNLYKYQFFHFDSDFTHLHDL